MNLSVDPAILMPGAWKSEIRYEGSYLQPGSIIRVTIGGSPGHYVVLATVDLNNKAELRLYTNHDYKLLRQTNCSVPLTQFSWHTKITSTIACLEITGEIISIEIAQPKR